MPVLINENVYQTPQGTEFSANNHDTKYKYIISNKLREGAKKKGGKYVFSEQVESF